MTSHDVFVIGLFAMLGLISFILGELLRLVHIAIDAKKKPPALTVMAGYYCFAFAFLLVVFRPDRFLGE